MKNLLTLIAICIAIQTNLFAQDLLERTQQNIQENTYENTQQNDAHKTSKSNQENKNRLATLVAQHRKSAKNSSVGIFNFSKSKSAKMAEDVTKSIELELDKTALKVLLTSKKDWLTLKIPVNENNYFELELVRDHIKAPGYKVTTSEANIKPYQNVELLFYKGIIKNDERSVAAVTISPDQIRILASDNEGNYVVGKLPESNARYVLYNDVNLKKDPQYSCGTPDVPHEDNVTANTAGTTIVNGQCVPIYLEVDYAFYQSNGNSVAAVETYLNGLFNEAETLYYNESIGLSISEIFVHTVPGPYANSNSTENALDIFKGLRQNNFNGRLAHLISGRPLGGGRAYVDVLCSVNTNHAVSQLYSYYYNFPTYSWDLYVFTHELGHNFGSRHTHACVWNGNNTAIDGCGTINGCPNVGIPSAGGTIMSYCHQRSVKINFSLGFGPQPGNLIRDRFNNSSCILECDESCNYVGNPCNFIPNPNFDNGSESWGFYNCNAFTQNGLLKIDNITGGVDPWSAIVNSDFLCLVQGVTYNVSFDAYSDAARDFVVKVGLGEAPWTSYLWEPTTLTTYFQNYTFQFTHTFASTSIGVLEFHVGGNGNLANVYFDNIVLQPAECAGNQVCELIENGDFEDGFTNWDYWGMTQPTISSGACYLSNFDSVNGEAFSWNAALNYTDLTFEQNQSYTVQFNARSSNGGRPIIFKVGLGQAPWTSYIWEGVYLTNQMQTFSYTFTMQDPGISNGTVEFQVGESNVPLFVDEVSLVENDCGSADLSNSCIENINLEGVPDANTYKAGVNIVSEAQILDGTNVSYFSGNRITLRGGFKVAGQAVFRADIESCD